MTKVSKAALEPGSVSLAKAAQDRTVKRPYESPRLVEWGSIIDLTGQDKLSSFDDGDFTGSGGV
jgi:hypothetical protein